MACLTKGSLAMLVVVVAFFATSTGCTRARNSCRSLHQAFDSAGCADPAAGPQLNGPCQQKYYNLCINFCTDSTPDNATCSRVSGHFVNSSRCAALGRQLHTFLDNIHVEMELIGCGNVHRQIGSLRLVDGTHLREGRVEVVGWDGEWGTVCDDGFNNNDAKVVCRQLGYPIANASYMGSAHFGPGRGNVWLDDLNCDGSETSILHCSARTFASHNCGHHEDVSVICR